MRRLLTLTVSAAAVAACLAAAPAASADTQTTTDPKGDTKVLGAPTRHRATPVGPAVDITRVRTVYEGQKVKVVLTVANLGAAGSDDFFQYVARARSGQSDYIFGIIKQGPQVEPLLQPTQLPDRSGLLEPTAGRGEVDCTPAYDLDKKKDTITLVATRGCLGAGASVRTGAIAAVMVGEDFSFRADDGRRKGRVSYDASDIELGRAVDRN